MHSIEDAFAIAVDHQQSGRLAAAQLIYERIVEAAPTCPAALNNLGLLMESGDAIRLFKRAVAAEPNYVDALVNLSSALQATGEWDDAAEAYDRALALIPVEPESLFHLGHMLQTQGRFTDAATQYERAIRLKPDFAAALCNLGVIHTQAEQHGRAAACYRRALASNPSFATANLNMITMLESEGRLAEAKRYRKHIRRPQDLVAQPAPDHRRTVLLISNTCVGNIPLDAILPKQTNTLITWQAEFATMAQSESLPPYDVAFNVIGNADILDESFETISHFAARHPVLNAPAAVARTRRDRLPNLLAGIPGVVVPNVVRLTRDEIAGPDLVATLANAGISCPLLLRPIAGHGGDGANRFDTPDQLARVEAGEADAYYAIAYHDYAQPDGFFRKYRVIFIDRKPYPYHLAISDHWLVHYFSASMLSATWKRREERRFLEDPGAVLGPTAMTALTMIGERIDLDFAGIDFTVRPDGQVLVFEANATMLVHLRDDPVDFPYKHARVPAIFTAFEAMLDRQAAMTRQQD